MDRLGENFSSTHGGTMSHTELVELLEQLDGSGLVITDWNLLLETLAEEGYTTKTKGASR